MNKFGFIHIKIKNMGYFWLSYGNNLFCFFEIILIDSKDL